MQPAALYYWYESKEDLLYKIMETAVDGLTERVLATIDPSASPPRRLEQAITAHITTIADHLDELSVFLHETKALNPRHRDRIQVKRARYEHIFRDILHDGLQSGDFPHIDPRLARFMILAACNWLYNWYKPDSSYQPGEIARAYSDMILNGLQRSSSNPT
jgi:AcrR family transcriptional regulator